MARAETDARGDAVDLGPLTDSLGFLLRMSQLVSFEEYFESMAELDLRPGELSVLLVIQRNPGIRQGIVAQRLMIKRAHMAKMMRALEEAGLVTRSVPEDDRRAVELRLSPKGLALVQNAEQPFRAHEARPLATLDRQQEAQLKALLRTYLGLQEPEKGVAT